MTNFWTQIKKPALVLAPMAGITDQPFRLICKEFGVDVTYSEMISSEALFHNAISKSEARNPKQIRNSNSQILKTLNLIKFSKLEKPFVVQIFGSDPEHMAFVAEYIASGEWRKDYEKMSNVKCQNENQKFDIGNLMKIENCKLKIESIPSGIDINMGCPAKDIIKTGAGAALIKNPKLAEKIIKAIKKKVQNIPISVKTRIGWNDNKFIGSFARMCEQSGVDAIAIHGRTVKQGFSGVVDWETICKVKKALKIPVIGNGGINMNNELGIMNYAKKLDGIMIGQGALGRPWLFDLIKKQITNSKLQTPNKSQFSKTSISKQSLKKIVLEHVKLVQKIKGEEGIIEFRKHLGWYFSGMPNVKQIRKQLVNVNKLNDVKSILSQV